MTPERAKKVLRDYEDLSAEERNNDERTRLSDAVDSLHPEKARNRLDADTIKVIDFLRECSGDDDPVTGLEINDVSGLGAEGMKRVIEKAIDDHGVWIGDNSDAEARWSKVIYFIAGEGGAPADWTGYVPGKQDADSTTSDRSARQEKRMHVAFLRAYASLSLERQSVADNEKRFSDAIGYLHPAPKQRRRRPLDQTPEETEKQRAAVRKHSTDAERLLAAVGVEGLRDSLPPSYLAMIEDGDEMTDARIAEAAIAAHGPDALCECRYALDHLDPPDQWAGLKPAVKFVRSLGFSAEWAGARNRSLPPYVEVEGPYALPELHDFQGAIVKNVRSMLLPSDGDRAQRRGMISMPTGSGKTRVAVQSVVEAIRHDGFEGGVLWVADREELCEQAFEAWRQVWSGIGPHATRLLISKMWGNQAPPPKPTTRRHVVVATIKMLTKRISAPEYGFLRDFTLVVFDEAHRSVTRESTSVMQEIGLTRWQRPDEPHLLGLTATPYRGHDARETARLAKRYGRNRLDSGAFASDDPQAVIRQLQDMRILSRADHGTVEGGVFPLDDREKEQAASGPWLPSTVEHRIAQDSDRTRRIIEAYEAYVRPDWPTLIFATSVEHAQTVAALLRERGVRSRAVSGDTRGADRRRAVEEFRRGEINVLVNCRLLAEGFDAPKTRAIIVARPVYSPNLYFQMIGRGLRGVKNGGNDRCLILNVQDNIENFGRTLAFVDLEGLWEGSDRSPS